MLPRVVALSLIVSIRCAAFAPVCRVSQPLLSNLAKSSNYVMAAEGTSVAAHPAHSRDIAQDVTGLGEVVSLYDAFLIGE